MNILRRQRVGEAAVVKMLPLETIIWKHMRFPSSAVGASECHDAPRGHTSEMSQSSCDITWSPRLPSHSCNSGSFIIECFWSPGVTRINFCCFSLPVSSRHCSSRRTTRRLQTSIRATYRTLPRIHYSSTTSGSECVAVRFKTHVVHFAKNMLAGYFDISVTSEF
jgi:hypothetical protein